MRGREQSPHITPHNFSHGKDLLAGRGKHLLPACSSQLPVIDLPALDPQTPPSPSLAPTVLSLSDLTARESHIKRHNTGTSLMVYQT